MRWDKIKWTELRQRSWQRAVYDWLDDRRAWNQCLQDTWLTHYRMDWLLARWWRRDWCWCAARPRLGTAGHDRRNSGSHCHDPRSVYSSPSPAPDVHDGSSDGRRLRCGHHHGRTATIRVNTNRLARDRGRSGKRERLCTHRGCWLPVAHRGLRRNGCTLAQVSTMLHLVLVIVNLFEYDIGGFLCPHHSRGNHWVPLDAHVVQSLARILRLQAAAFRQMMRLIVFTTI